MFSILLDICTMYADTYVCLCIIIITHNTGSLDVQFFYSNLSSWKNVQCSLLGHFIKFITSENCWMYRNNMYRMVLKCCGKYLKWLWNLQSFNKSGSKWIKLMTMLNTSRCATCLLCPIYRNSAFGHWTVDIKMRFRHRSGETTLTATNFGWPKSWKSLITFEHVLT